MQNEAEAQLKEETLSLDFLQEQFRLPESDWDERFRELIRALIQENQQAILETHENLEKGVGDLTSEDKQENPEKLREELYAHYLSSLNLKESDLIDKSILDLGCGFAGFFVQYLIEHKITDNVLGVDLNLHEEKVNEKFKKNLIKGDLAGDLPMQNADYIFSVGAVSMVGHFENKGQIVKKWIESLKAGGEIRIYPIPEPSEKFPWESVIQDWQEWNKFIQEINLEGVVECRLEPKGVRIIGKDNEMVLDHVMIIKRK